MLRRKVLKYGGKSVDSIQKRMQIARNIAEEAEAQQVVVVCSAISGTTDRLIQEISAIPSVPQSVVDFYVATGEYQAAALLAAAACANALAAEVVPPTSLFTCTNTFGDADVMEINPAPLLSLFSRGAVPVVPGFIGATPDGRVCLLGRGGSDYSAVLLGAALHAEVTLFKNDTDGIYTSDPNIDCQAERYARLTHSEALELSTLGAKVLNQKAALAALMGKVTVIVRSTFGEGSGTVIAADFEKKKRPSNCPDML